MTCSTDGGTYRLTEPLFEGGRVCAPAALVSGWDGEDTAVSFWRGGEGGFITPGLAI